VLPASLLLFLLLRLVFWLSTFPNPDEAYYWLWGQHPALSYYDHPPFLAWIQAMATSILGRSFFTLRLPNLVSNGVLLFTYFRITRYLYGHQGRSAFELVVAVLLSSPLYFLFLALAWPDHWLITFSLGSAFLWITFLDGYRAGRGETWRLYSAAVLLGLAGLCKYNALFVGLGLVAVVLADPALRSLGRDRRLYLAGGMALLALMPIGLWNLSNDFQSFRYYADRSLDSGSLSVNLLSPLGFWLLSAMTVSPFHCFSFYRAWKLRFPGLQPQSCYVSVAFWVFAASTGGLTAISLVSTALYYWNITAYLLLIPLLPAAFLDRAATHPINPVSSAQPRSFGGSFWTGQVYGLLFAGLLVLHYSLVPISAWVNREGDPDSRMLFGWERVAQGVRAEAAKLEQPLLLTTDYRSAAALAYELNDKTVLAISDRVDQFDFWYPGDQAIAGRNAILLSDDWHPLSPQLIARFDRTSEPVTVTVDRFGIWIKRYSLRRAYGFRPGLNDRR
jgi:4-amino-4-deoxy-L-arabinose transferase-like glycosyltransferase